jgi:hypothetical protein
MPCFVAKTARGLLENLIGRVEYSNAESWEQGKCKHFSPDFLWLLTLLTLLYIGEQKNQGINLQILKKKLYKMHSYRCMRPLKNHVRNLMTKLGELFDE